MEFNVEYFICVGSLVVLAIAPVGVALLGRPSDQLGHVEVGGADAAIQCHGEGCLRLEIIGGRLDDPPI